MNINPKIKGHAGFGMAFSFYVSCQEGVKSSFKSPCTPMRGPQKERQGKSQFYLLNSKPSKFISHLNSNSIKIIVLGTSRIIHIKPRTYKSFKSCKSKTLIASSDSYGNSLFLYCPDTNTSRNMGIKSITVSNKIAKFQIDKRRNSLLSKCSSEIDIKGNTHFALTNIRRNIHIRCFILLHKMESNTSTNKKIR